MAESNPSRLSGFTVDFAVTGAIPQCLESMYSLAPTNTYSYYLVFAEYIPKSLADIAHNNPIYTLANTRRRPSSIHHFLIFVPCVDVAVERDLPTIRLHGDIVRLDLRITLQRCLDFASHIRCRWLNARLDVDVVGDAGHA